MKTALSLIALIAVGCTSSASEPLSEPLEDTDFVPIEKELGDTASTAAGKLDDAGHRGKADLEEDFYLAVRRSALEGRWFMSTYLQQFFASGPEVTARTLGTRVIAFRLQNEKLFVVDASGLDKLSDTFDPERIIEAYPLVKLDRFEGYPNSHAFVLIDPSAGLNRFSAIGDSFANPGSAEPIQFEMELSFLQRFRRLGDGVAFDQVFTGFADEPITSAPGLNAFQASGTLTVSFRRYAEGDGFAKFPMPQTPYFFEQGLLAPTGNPEPLAAKWNIRAGMDPIKWEISRGVLELAELYPDVDVVGAVKNGVTGWNKAFGFEAITAEIATPEALFSDDDRNFLIVDPQLSVGFAFADFRTNPVSGEIRGASVFFDSTWFDPTRFADDPDESDASQDPNVRPAVPGLLWNGSGNDHLCVRYAHEIRNELRRESDTPANLTANEKVELFVTHVIAHEIGHTLGLRHNWKGSLLPPTSSVMEYATNEASVATPEPLAYDHEAIAFLYGSSGAAPTQPFCTDSDHEFQADCFPFDEGARPLVDDHGPFWNIVLAGFEAGTFPPSLVPLAVRVLAGPIISYMRESDADVAREASSLLLERLAVPQPSDLSDEVASLRDALLSGVLTKMYTPLGGDGSIQGPLHPSMSGLLLNQTLRVGLNEDGIRSFSSRRSAIDGLVVHQTNEALNALLTMRDGLEAQIAAGLPTEEENLTRDLIARIDAGTDPYFD